MVKKLDKKNIVWGEKEGAELRRLRERNGLTLKFCLEKVGKGKGAWNTWELGKNTPSASDIFVIETVIFPELKAGYFENFSSGNPAPSAEQPREDLNRSMLDVLRGIQHTLGEVIAKAERGAPAEGAEKTQRR